MKYKCGYKYITGEEVVVPVPEAGVDLDVAYGIFVRLKDRTLYMCEAWPWNGASFILFYWFGTPVKWMKPSAVHDGLYELMRNSKIPLTFRKVADGIFYRLLRENGVSWIVAKCAYYAVRIGGNYALRHGAKMKEAP